MTKTTLLLLIINSILVVMSNLFLAFQVVKRIAIKKVMEHGFIHLKQEYTEMLLRKKIKKYSKIKTIKMSFIEGVEVYLIDKSNVKRYLPFVNFYVLLGFCLLIFIIGYKISFSLLHYIPSALIMSFLASLIPVSILDIMGRYNSEKIRRKLTGFISVLNRWCSVKEDIFYAFEKSLESDIGEPLNSFVRDLVIQVNIGIPPMDALSMLQMKVDNYQFKDFIINIKQNVRYRGDIKKLLGNLEEQFYKIEEEYNRRKISTYRDRLTIYFTMALVLFIGYLFLKANPGVRNFYLGNSLGKVIITFFCILYSLGFYLTLGISKFDY